MLQTRSHTNVVDLQRLPAWRRGSLGCSLQRALAPSP